MLIQTNSGCHKPWNFKCSTICCGSTSKIAMDVNSDNSDGVMVDVGYSNRPDLHHPFFFLGQWLEQLWIHWAVRTAARTRVWQHILATTVIQQQCLLLTNTKSECKNQISNHSTKHQDFNTENLFNTGPPPVSLPVLEKAFFLKTAIYLFHRKDYCLENDQHTVNF